MGHRWLSTDNGSQCFRCGLVIDYRTENEMGGNFAEEFSGASDLAHALAPGCSGPDTKRAHHLTIGSDQVDGMDLWVLECGYGDPIAGPECLGPDDVYGPDGRALDGPRTTAAEYALLGYAYRVDHFTYSGWRNAAADEGSRYVDAIRGANRMRRVAAFGRCAVCDEPTNSGPRSMVGLSHKYGPKSHEFTRKDG